jgi:RHS repeat-associated protein
LVQQWLYRNQLNPIAELDGAGNIVAQFVYGARSNTPDYMVRGGVAYRILTDRLGSPRLVVDASTGAVVQRVRHDAFGGVVEATGTSIVAPFGFAGGAYDAETGFVRFGARDYDSTVGRWVSKDPILFGGGQANLFEYANNEPINRTDSTGLMVYLCSRIAELTGDQSRDTANGFRHWWIWNSETGSEAGAGPATGGWAGVGGGFFSSTAVRDHRGAHGEVSWKVVQCVPQPDVDESCSDQFTNESQYGNSLGPWIPYLNDCSTFTWSVLTICSNSQTLQSHF